jgi:hypothetical protein
MSDGVAENDLMHIKVIYMDNSAGVVKASSLEQLITTRRIVAFRRSEGWVKIGRDPVRGKGGKYKGPERRNPSKNNHQAP